MQYPLRMVRYKIIPFQPTEPATITEFISPLPAQTIYHPTPFQQTVRIVMVYIFTIQMLVSRFLITSLQLPAHRMAYISTVIRITAIFLQIG